MAELTREQMLSCPFCGFKPDVNDPDAVYPTTRDRTVWGAHCYEAGGGCAAEVLGKSAQDAIAKWNRRDPALRALEQTNAAGQGQRGSRTQECDSIAAPAAPHSEAICPECKGSGDVRGMTHQHGPDDYEAEVQCLVCNGTGMILTTPHSEPQVPGLTTSQRVGETTGVPARSDLQAYRESLRAGKCPNCGTEWDEVCYAYDGPHCGPDPQSPPPQVSTQDGSPQIPVGPASAGDLDALLKRYAGLRKIIGDEYNAAGSAYFNAAVTLASAIVALRHRAEAAERDAARPRAGVSMRFTQPKG